MTDLNIDPKLPTWQQVALFVEHMDGKVTIKEMENFLQLQNRNTANARPDACMLSVNMNSRVHYFGGKEPRRTDSGNRYDLFFRQSDSSYVPYNSAIHGIWEIYQTSDGTRKVRQVADPLAYGREPEANTEINDGGDGLFEGSNQFRMESHLRDYLAQNLGLLQGLGTSLSLYTEAGNTRGIEFQTEVGPIDILAFGADGAYYVIELKLGRGPDSAVGQTLRYITAIKKTIAKGNPVYGVIVASTITDKLRYSVSEVQDRIFVMEYELKVTLRKASMLA